MFISDYMFIRNGKVSDNRLGTPKVIQNSYFSTKFDTRCNNGSKKFKNDFQAEDDFEQACKAYLDFLNMAKS